MKSKTDDHRDILIDSGASLQRNRDVIDLNATLAIVPELAAFRSSQY